MPENRTTNMDKPRVDRIAATLGLATRLSESLMPKAPQEAPVSPETAPGSEETLDLEEEPTKEEIPDLEAKFDVLSQDITSVKEMLQQLLNSKEE